MGTATTGLYPLNVRIMEKYRIMIVDDEQDILDFLEYNLRNDGYDVICVREGETALRMAPEEKPDLILMDVMMPRMDGVETCRRLREIPGCRNIYIIFLTARSEEFSELAAFEAGADDYIVKPIKPRVLLSRIKAIFRRGSDVDGSQPQTLKIADLEIVRDEYIVYKNGQSLALPKKEFELLFFLASKPNKVFSREVLLEKIWGKDVYVVPRTIDVHIRKLREKLGEEYIHTVKGVGYKFLG